MTDENKEYDEIEELNEIENMETNDEEEKITIEYFKRAEGIYLKPEGDHDSNPFLSPSQEQSTSQSDSTESIHIDDESDLNTTE